MDVQLFFDQWVSRSSPALLQSMGVQVFFEDVIGLEVPAADSGQLPGLRVLMEKSGFVGDFKSKNIRPAAAAGVPDYPRAWLPLLRVARVWQALVTDQPFNH